MCPLPNAQCPWSIPGHWLVHDHVHGVRCPVSTTCRAGTGVRGRCALGRPWEQPGSEAAVLHLLRAGDNDCRWLREAGAGPLIQSVSEPPVPLIRAVRCPRRCPPPLSAVRCLRCSPPSSLVAAVHRPPRRTVASVRCPLFAVRPWPRPALKSQMLYLSSRFRHSSSYLTLDIHVRPEIILCGMSGLPVVCL